MLLRKTPHQSILRSLRLFTYSRRNFYSVIIYLFIYRLCVGGHYVSYRVTGNNVVHTRLIKYLSVCFFVDYSLSISMRRQLIRPSASTITTQKSLAHNLIAAQDSTLERNIAQHSTNKDNRAQQSATQHNITQHSTTQHSIVQHSTTWHNIAQHSTTKHNIVQYSTTQHNIAQHNTTQYNIAQYSTRQYNMAQRSTK